MCAKRFTPSFSIDIYDLNNSGTEAIIQNDTIYFLKQKFPGSPQMVFNWPPRLYDFTA